MPIYLLIPFASAVTYALGSIAIKRALSEGTTMDQAFYYANFVLGAVFLPFFFLETRAIDWTLAWQPALMGLAFLSGTWLTFVAIRMGDVSLVTPIMGTKVVFVAIGAVWLMGETPSLLLWIAAAFTAAGIFIMGLADLRGVRAVVPTVGITLASAGIFGLCDVMVSAWSRDFGAKTFLALGTMGVTGFSVIKWVVSGCVSLRVPSGAVLWVWVGSFAIALQAAALGLALSFYRDPTGINVVYASRGLWVIVLIVGLGGWLGNREHHALGRAFLWRIGGTILLTTAIVIAVFDRSGAR